MPTSKPNAVDETLSPATKYVFDFNIPLKLTTKLKINNNSFMALGSIEGIKYDEVVSGKFVPSEPDFVDDSRIFVLDSILATLISDYNKLRNYGSIIKPSDELKQLIEGSDIKRFQYGKLSDILPELYGDFYEKYAQIRKTLKPREIIEYLLQHIADFCLAVLECSDVTEIKTQKLRQSFIEKIMHRIIRADEMKSKPGQVNWTIFRRDVVVETEDTVVEEAAAAEEEVQLGEEDIKDMQGVRVVADDENTETVDEPENVFENHFDIDNTDVDIHDVDAEDDSGMNMPEDSMP